MRTRLLAALTAAVLSLPLTSAAVPDWPFDHGCDSPVTTERTCESGKG